MSCNCPGYNRICLDMFDQASQPDSNTYYQYIIHQFNVCIIFDFEYSNTVDAFVALLRISFFISPLTVITPNI